MRKTAAKTALATLKIVGATLLAFAILKGAAVLAFGLLFGFNAALRDEGYAFVGDVMGFVGAAAVLVLFLAKALIDAMDRIINVLENRRPKDLAQKEQRRETAQSTRNDPSRLP